MVSILIVDDHALVRRGLRQALTEEFRGATFGQAKSAEEALRAVARRHWDLVCLDIGMPDRDGFEILQEVRRQRPDSKVLVLSVHSERRYAARAIQLGATGYVSKGASLPELHRAVRKVLAGEQYLCAAVSRKHDGSASDHETEGDNPPKPLSARERQILVAVAAGKSMSGIAAELDLDIRTVSTYKRRLLDKLHLGSTASLVRYAIDHGLC
jgi:two-component system, NarL family, invasion response regulator UvrY